jgi:hypothetical protein
LKEWAFFISTGGDMANDTVKQKERVIRIQTDRPGDGITVLTITDNGRPVGQISYPNAMGHLIALAALSEYNKPEPKRGNIITPTGIGGPNVRFN